MQKYAYMIVTDAGNPVLLEANLPIYWRKEIAEREAEHRTGGAKVVRIDMPHASSG